MSVVREPRSGRSKSGRWRGDGVTTGAGGWLDDSMFSELVWRRLAESLGWSHREAQIVPALFADRKETTIAVRLGISRHTVHTHTERLYRKMGITTRVQLVRCVFVEYLRVSGAWHQDAKGPGTARPLIHGSHRPSASRRR